MSYAVMAEDPELGAVQLKMTFEPDIEVVTGLGVEGTFAACEVKIGENDPKPHLFLPQILNW